jgi:hypothetical protein
VLAGLIAVVVLAVGVPIAAVWVGRRPFWAAHRARTDGDPWPAILREHSLTAEETHRVARAVQWGNRLPEERLRRAVADWALRDLAHLRGAPSPLRRRATVAAVAAALLVAAAATLRLATGHGTRVDGGALAIAGGLLVGLAVLGPYQRWWLGRVIRRNEPAGERAG